MLHQSSVVTEIQNYPALVHCSSFLEVGNTHLCVWYEGSFETSADTVLKMAKKRKQESVWGFPTVLFDLKGLALGNPVLWKLSEREVFLTFPVLLASSWTESLLFFSISKDGGNTWQPPSLFYSRKGYMPKTRPLLQKDGPILFPLYHEQEFCPYVLIIQDPYTPWHGALVGETMARGKAIQPVLVQRDSQSLLMYCRTNQGVIWKSLSYNKGYSWSICTPTQIPNPNSAIDLVSWRDIICLVYNDSSLHRHALKVALSKDGGASWFCSRVLKTVEGEVSYPSLWVDEEGIFHVTYTINRFQIGYSSFDIEWVEAEVNSEPFYG